MRDAQNSLTRRKQCFEQLHPIIAAETPSLARVAKTKAMDAIKKYPRQFTRLGSSESLPHLFRLLGWAAGVSGDGVAALPA